MILNRISIVSIFQTILHIKKCQPTTFNQWRLTSISLIFQFGHCYCNAFRFKARIIKYEKFCYFTQENDGLAYVGNVRNENVIKCYDITSDFSDLAEYRKFTVSCKNEDPITAVKLFFQLICTPALTLFLTILSSWIKICLFLASAVIFLYLYSSPFSLHNMYKKPG